MLGLRDELTEGVLITLLGIEQQSREPIHGTSVCRGNPTDPRDDRHIVGTGRTHEFDGEQGVSCDDARELISAAADDALSGDEPALLDVHVRGCRDCTAYQERVTALSRSIRVRAADVDPEFVDAVLARTRPARLGRGGWLRPALAWCGLILTWRSISPLVLGELADTPTHVARHVGASTLALAIGMLYVAWRPHRAAGLLPFVGALFAALFIGATVDVLSGDRSPVSELAHAVEFLGTVVLWMVAGSPGWHHVERAVTFGRRGVAPSTN